MAEIYPVHDVLEKLKDFNPLQRILMSMSGTLQSTLSAYFSYPIEIEVLAQVPRKEDYPGMIIREINLVLKDKPVCFAKTTVYTSDLEIIELVNACELGLGQIMQHKGIKPNFKLKRVGQDKDKFWRVYALEGPPGPKLFDCGTLYHIREEFPQELYQWPPVLVPRGMSSEMTVSQLGG